MSLFARFVAIAFFLIAPLGVARAQCPPHAHFTGSTEKGEVKTIHCKCDDGYEARGGACVPITTMRARTRPECIRAAGTDLSEDLARCRAPLLALCITDPSANEKVATCLTVAALIKFDPSKVTVLGALIACGFAAPDAYKVIQQCPEIRDDCLAKSLKTHKDSVKACNAN
jgi:hypothetical protein